MNTRPILNFQLPFGLQLESTGVNFPAVEEKGAKRPWGEDKQIWVSIRDLGFFSLGFTCPLCKMRTVTPTACH